MTTITKEERSHWREVAANATIGPPTGNVDFHSPGLIKFEFEAKSTHAGDYLFLKTFTPSGIISLLDDLDTTEARAEKAEAERDVLAELVASGCNCPGNGWQYDWNDEKCFPVSELTHKERKKIDVWKKKSSKILRAKIAEKLIQNKVTTHTEYARKVEELRGSLSRLVNIINNLKAQLEDADSDLSDVSDLCNAYRAHRRRAEAAN